MKILYVSQYYPPEMGAPSARVHELSREWARLGHEVTVLTGFAHHPTGVKAPADRWRLTRREKKDGIDVVRAYVYATPNKGNLRRMLSYLSFMLSACVVGAFRAERPDVVIGTSPQLLTALAAWFLSRRFRRPFVFEVRDLWPESILAVGAMGDNLVVRGLKGAARALYRRCAMIVTVGPGYKRQIATRYGIEPRKIRVVPNGIDSSLFKPGPRNNAVRRALGWGKKPVVLYLGTLGMAHGLATALEAAKATNAEIELLWVFVGEGAEKEKLQGLAAKWGLSNVQFIGQQPKEKVVELYRACDLGLVMLRDTPLFQDVLPSKIFEYLAMEKPVVLAVGGDAKRLIEKAGAGVYVPPEDPVRLVKAVLDLLGDPQRLAFMGREGRKYVLEHYNRKVLAEKYLELLQEARRPGPVRG